MVFSRESERRNPRRAFGRCWQKLSPLIQSAASAAYLDAHQAVLLCVLKKGLRFQIGRVARFVLVGLDPAQILTPPESPLSETLPTLVQTLCWATPEEHERWVPSYLGGNADLSFRGDAFMFHEITFLHCWGRRRGIFLRRKVETWNKGVISSTGLIQKRGGR